MKNKKNTDKIIYIILFTIIILLSAFLIWNFYINDLHKEYDNLYNENCYKVEHDENSITITKYYINNDTLSYTEKVNFENGKPVSYNEIYVYKTKEITNNSYKDKLKYNNNIKRIGKNSIEYTVKIQDLTDSDYDSPYLKENIENFTTNKETIDFLLKYGEENNFNIPDNFKKI